MHTVVLARTDEQRAGVRALGLERVVVPERTVDGRSLVALADVLVSAGGTMNREAAVLGTPVWSIFEGRLGAVDEKLMSEGRLRSLRLQAQKAERYKRYKAELKDLDLWSSAQRYLGHLAEDRQRGTDLVGP